MARLYNFEAPPKHPQLACSQGPYLCTGNDIFLFDAGSPPALGYNASSLFGVVHHLESWTENKSTENWRWLCSAYRGVLDRQPDPSVDLLRLERELPAAALIRGYIQDSVREQFPDEIHRIQSQVSGQLRELVARHGQLVAASATSTGLRPDPEPGFQLKLPSNSRFREFCRRRFRFGLNFRCCPQTNSARFRLNLGCRPADVELLFRQLNGLLINVSGKETNPQPPGFTLGRSPNRNYDFARRMIAARIDPANAGADQDAVSSQLRDQVNHHPMSDGLEVTILTPDNYPQFRSRILELQAEIYEPARQSPPSEFDAIFATEKPVGIVIHRGPQIVAMGFAGPIGLFANVRGMRSDPYRNQSDVLYMVDVTVIPEYRGGFGRAVKNAIALIGLQLGYSAIHGRNRDRLARSMWAINLSLGSFELQHLVEDYPDQGPHRDCFYYRCPLQWAEPAQLDRETVEQRLPLLVNGSQPVFD